MARLSKYGILITLMTAVAVLLATSCDNGDCMGNSNGIPLAGFYHGDALVEVTDLTVYGVGAPNDSAIIRNSQATQVYLPLKLNTNTCQYVFDYNIYGYPNDTLSLTYDIIPYFESHECGAMFNFKIKEWTHTTNEIDSIAIPNPMITNTDVITIKIYMQ